MKKLIFKLPFMFGALLLSSTLFTGCADEGAVDDAATDVQVEEDAVGDGAVMDEETGTIGEDEVVE